LILTFRAVALPLAVCIHELLREVLQKCSAKQMSSELGLSLSLIYKWAEPPDQDAGAAQPTRSIASRLFIAAARTSELWNDLPAGRRFFIRNPEQTISSRLSDSGHQSDCPEFADLLAVIATAAGGQFH